MDKIVADLKVQLDAKDAMITVHLSRVETVREVNMVLSDTIDSQRGRIAELEAQISDKEMLEGDASLLACLYAAGVGGWDGFDEACALNFRGEGKASATAKRIAELEARNRQLEFNNEQMAKEISHCPLCGS